MTKEDIERMARDMLHAYGVHTEPYTRGGGDHPIMGPLAKVLRRAFNAGVEAGGAVCDMQAGSIRRANTYRGRVSEVAEHTAHMVDVAGSNIRALKLPE